MARLLDTIDEKEKAELEKKAKEENSQNGDKGKTKKRPTVTQIIPREGRKDKTISAKVNSAMYNVFTDICKVQGLSNNSCLNMILSDYVREKKYLLDEE